MLEKIIKRSLVVIAALLGIVSAITVVQAVQNTAPVISVGWSVVNYQIGVSAPSAFTTSTAVSHATAIDAEDGNITNQIQAAGVNSVDTTVPGTYYITLSVVDSGGLTDTFVREINVRNQGDTTPGRCYENGNLSDVYTKCPPVITLLGDNPMTIQLNATFTDPGATSTDFEDGDLTSSIVATGTVNTSATGTYPLVYSVVDSDNFSAETTRTVNVVYTPSPKGSIKVCKIIADQNDNIIAGPAGATFIVPGGSGLSTTTFTTPLALNTNLFGDPTLDAQCYTYSDLDIKTYHYGQEIATTASPIVGIGWDTPLYNDQLTVDIADLDDFYLFGANNNANGEINLALSKGPNRTLVVLNSYHLVVPPTQCSDSVDNDGDGKVDYPADPGCQSPTDADENQPPLITLLGLNPMTVALNATFTDPGATSSDPEDGDLTSSIVATGTVNTSATGTYPILYSVVDSGGLTATATRSVIVAATSVPPIVYQCSDQLDNDSDGVIDTNDRTCHSDGIATNTQSYVPDKNTENEAPVITITGGANLEIFVGDVYNDRGATAQDFEDGDITANITATGTVSTVNTGTYRIYYNVKDSQGLAAVEKVRTVVVKEQSGCGSNCGGGVYIPPTPTLSIFDEKIDPQAGQSVLITWKTDNSADSRVVYGTSSISGTVVGFANYGYTNSTLTNNDLTMSHSMLITGLLPNTNYYFKPVSDNPSVEPVLGKELSLITGQPQVVPPVITECNYLLEYLRIDLPNNPLEVIKLQSFLKNNEGFGDLIVNGVFDQATLSAVNAFQVKYSTDVLSPWGYSSNQPTGYVYITTQKKINELYCQKPFPLTLEQEQEIAWARALYEAISQQGGQATTTLPIIGQTEPSSGGAVAGQPNEPVAIAQPEVTQPETEQPEISSDLGIANITDISNIGEDSAENQASQGKKEGGLFPATLLSALPSTRAFLILDLSLIVILVVLALFFVYLRRKRKQESEILVRGPNSSLLKNLPGIESAALNLD